MRVEETVGQSWSESGLVSPAVSPSPQSQSPSPSGVSPSSSSLDQSPSPSPVGQCPSLSPTKVRVSPDLSSDSGWTHESSNRKVLYFNPTFNNFAEPCIDNCSYPKFPSFLLTYREINPRKHIGSNHNIV